MSDYKIEISEYKGNAVFGIFKDERRVMGFGLKKAQAILACVDAIREFVKKNEETDEK